MLLYKIILLVLVTVVYLIYKLVFILVKKYIFIGVLPLKNELKINAEVLGIIESYISRLDSLMEYLKSVEKILKDKRKSLFFKNATFRNFTNMNLVAHLLESKARNYGEVYELATHKK